MRLAFIEDDGVLLHELTEHFRGLGYAIDATGDGEEGLYLLTQMPIDAAVVDLGLPSLNGLDIIKKARAHGKDLPILILTARSQWQEKVAGLEAGADDYLTKPFAMAELEARLRALLRRHGRWASATMKCGPLELDPASKNFFHQNRPLKLTAAEFKVLEYLMLHAGEVISKDTLHNHIYEEEVDHDSNVLEVFIRRLRKKIDPKGKLKPIETLRGQGYRLNFPRG